MPRKPLEMLLLQAENGGALEPIFKLKNLRGDGNHTQAYWEYYGVNIHEYFDEMNHKAATHYLGLLVGTILNQLSPPEN